MIQNHYFRLTDEDAALAGTLVGSPLFSGMCLHFQSGTVYGRNQEKFMCRYCVLFCCCLLLGCGSSKTYDVQATVTLDGTPLAEAEVTFVPLWGKAKRAVGNTDQEGMVTFKTDERDGILPGSYTVIMSKVVDEKRLTNSEIRAFAEVGIPYREKKIELVPEKYTRSETSDLKAKVGYWYSPNLTFHLGADKSASGTSKP